MLSISKHEVIEIVCVCLCHLGIYSENKNKFLNIL